MVAGAGALVYFLWKKNKANPADDIDDAAATPDDLKRKRECIRSGGDWVQPYCAVAPCYGICVK